MLRQVLLRSSASRLTKRSTRRLSVHTNACKQEEAEEETGASTDSVEKKPTRSASAPRAVEGKREHDHRSLFSFSGPQSQHGAAIRKEFRASAPKEPRASSLSLEMHPV